MSLSYRSYPFPDQERGMFEKPSPAPLVVCLLNGFTKTEHARRTSVLPQLPQKEDYGEGETEVRAQNTSELDCKAIYETLD